MPFAIKYRKVGQRDVGPSETLAVDFDSHKSANASMERLASSFPLNGSSDGLATRWFRCGDGLHLIWVQAQ